MGLVPPCHVSLLNLGNLLFPSDVRPVVTIFYTWNGLGACLSLEEAQFFSALIRADLSEAGITEQMLKCDWDPCKSLLWLGIFIDLLNRILKILESKWERAQNAL